MREIERVKEQYSKLGMALIEKGIKIANLSQTSLIESWPKMTLDQFETL
jgi:N-dimethylarginine dimethylaminohydrolase